MGDPIFGVAIRLVDEEARPVIGADLSTIGLIGPSSDSDAAVFPLNEPVRVYSNQVRILNSLGKSGYLLDAIRGINDQLGETQFAARIIVVRTPEGTDVDPAIKLQQTIANVMGSSTSKTGIWAFTKSVSKYGVTPRLLIAPGYTSQMATSVQSVTRTTLGTGYVEGQSYPLIFTNGGPNAVQATGHALGLAGGGLGAGVIDTPGAWYDTPPTVTVDPAQKTVTTAVIAGGGNGYVVGDTITLANGVILTVATVTTGAVATTTITHPGFIPGGQADPTNPQAQVSSSGAGEAATFTLTWTASTPAVYTATVSVGANPVAVSMSGLCNQLLGVAIVESAGTSEELDADWRETLNHKRIIAFSGGVRVVDPDTSAVVVRPLAPRVVGIAVRRDHEKGAPFHSWANQAIQGIVGPNRDIPFALTDDANEAQSMLGFNIGSVVRGELGNEFAIASGGFILLGTDNTGDDELWRHYNMVRGRDYIHLTLLRALRFYLGRYNITAHTVTALLTAEAIILRDLQADGHILGYKIGFNAASNTADEVRLGHVTIGFAAEEPSPLKKIVVESARYRQAIDIMLADLAASLNLAS